MPARAATDAILRAGRRLGSRGLISAGEGNISVRLDADRLLITPAGLRKDELDADDLVVVWLGHPDREAESRRPAAAPTSDLAIHLAVHAARPDIGAMVHAHLPSAMGLTLAGEVPDPAALPETALFLPRLPFLSLETPGSERLAAAHRGGADRAARAARQRGPPRAPRRLRGRARSRPRRSTASSSSRCSAARGAMRS